jgi:eukaryotic-like serine/threonine-protein kinase
MGQVWQAADEVLGRPVAVKLLRPEYAEHPETLERFRSEARHAGALSHPHIAQVYDYGHGYERGDARSFRDPYLVLEYVDGPSLADLIERGPLEASLTREIIAQAADGLAAAHRARLVHRDIKPGNLLLTADGRVKITDFGIAYAAGAAPITAPGIVMGTALYMAPERIAGGPGTPASDLYSLGVVMYECLSGRPPFDGTSAAVMAAHLHLPLPALPYWVPEPLAGLVAKLTAKDPSYRISDGAVLAARLRGLEPGRSLERYRPEGHVVPYYLMDPRRPGGLVSPPAGYLSPADPADLAAAVPPAHPAGQPRRARPARAPAARAAWPAGTGALEPRPHPRPRLAGSAAVAGHRARSGGRQAPDEGFQGRRVGRGRVRGEDQALQLQGHRAVDRVPELLGYLGWLRGADRARRRRELHDAH